MYFSDEGVLIDITIPIVDGEQQAPTETRTPVWYNDKSVRQSEFYAAAANGTQLEKMVEVHKEDWSGQTLFEDATGRRYKVYRHYSTEKDTVELTLQADGGA